MDSLQHSDDLDANHDTLIINVVTILSAFSFTALVLRLTARRIKRVLLHVDDYLAIASWVNSSTASANVNEPR